MTEYQSLLADLLSKDREGGAQKICTTQQLEQP